MSGLFVRATPVVTDSIARVGRADHTDPLDDSTATTAYTIGPCKVSVQMVAGLLGERALVDVVKRQDRHEDGSVSTTYYLELTEDQYKALEGK